MPSGITEETAETRPRRKRRREGSKQLLASGTTLVKPPVPTPTASSNANRFYPGEQH